MLTGVQVDHELRQCAVQACDWAAQYGKTRARELGRRFEVQAAADFAQGDVVLDLEIERIGGAPATHFDVLVFAGTDRHTGIGQVGNGQHDAVQFCLDTVQLGFTGGQFIGHALHISHQRGNVFALGLGLADGFGTGITLGLQLLGTGLHRLAALFQ